MKKGISFKILFYAKRSRVAQNGEVPIALRVTVNGQRCEISISVKIHPDLWNNVAGRATGKDRKSLEVNNRLDTIRLRLMEIYREMEFDKEEINAKAIIDKYMGRETKPKITLLSIFQEHNDRCRKLRGIDMAPATVTRYETTYKHTAEFIQFFYKKDDVALDEVNHQFIKDYEFYLKTERRCCHNTTTKYLKYFKKIIRIGLSNDLIKKDPFANIKFSLDDVERDFLEEHEIHKVMEKEIEIERLRIIRDAYIFACYTGLAFSDMKGLKVSHLVMDNDGAVWIRKSRKKTNTMSSIPLLDIPIRIIEDYKKQDYCVKTGYLFPIPSNQKMNAYLKEIADMCGITKQLTTHTARHTFATSVTLGNDVSIENVSKMLGHTSIKTTRIYAKILDKSVLRDMKKLNQKLSV